MSKARHRATDCISHVSRHREIGRMRFQSGFNCSKKAYLVNLPAPDSHSVLVEQHVVEAKEKTPDDLRVSSEEESTFCRRKISGDQIPASQLAGTSLHIFPKIRIGKCASSRTLRELRAGTVRKREETVFICRKKLVMHKWWTVK